MSKLLQVCLYNTDPEASRGLGEHLRSLNFVRLVAEVGTPEDLYSALQELGVNLVFFHLDPEPVPIVDVIDQVATRYPELAMIAISELTSPGEILAPMRAGCDQFVCKPIDQADLAAAVARVANRRLLSRTQGRCICVMSASGGGGATSIASNLALEIGNLTDSACGLVDLDFQFGDVASNFDAEPRYNFFDLAEAGDQLDRTVLASTVTELPCKVALIARPEMIEQAEHITPETVHHVIELLAAENENVVVDVPRRVDSITFAALKQADLILIVCQLTVPSIRNSKRLFETMTRTGIPEDRIEFIVNRGDSGARRITIKDLEDTVKKTVFAVVPNDYQFVARSLDYGRPIAALERNNPVRSAIRKIARRVVGDPAGGPKSENAHRGLLGRFFSK